jgi:hypothetical protein
VSYYPQPFPPPQEPFRFDFSRYPRGDPLAPARRASIALWVIGGLGLLCGVCAGIGVWIIPSDQLAAQMPRLTAEQQKQLGNVDAETILRIGFTVIGISALAVGLTMVVTAAFVRRGSRGAAVVAIVACSLTLLWSIVTVLASVVQMIGGNAASALTGLFWVVLGAALVVTVRWLVQTFRAGSMASSWQLWHAQVWQYQQQQQPGYGYGPPGPAAESAQPAPWMNLPPAPPTPGNPQADQSPTARPPGAT